jgi:speckle-type POZ protein
LITTYCCVFQITVLPQFETKDVVNSREVTKPFVTDIARMLDDELFVDFRIKSSDGEILKAHKVILAARSPVFVAMLSNEMQEAQENITTVPDFNAKILRELLRFIYTNKTENLDEMAHELIHAAEKYQLKELKNKCVASIVSTMTTENVIESLMISELIPDTEKVFNKCADFLLR